MFFADMKEIVSVYKRSVDTNLKDINSILKKLDIRNPGVFLSCKKILNLSADNVINKWLSGRKYSRTVFVKQAFGKFYPKKYIEISMSIDAIINILDDLLDEKINGKEKTLFILEFLRVYSLYNSRNIKEKIQTAIGHDFNKLISLAIAEKIYQKMIAKEKNIKKIIEYSMQIFNCRGTDIDIFNEIALTDVKNNNAVRKVKEMGRIFRAVNIFKKDIKDINYDKKNGVETIVILMSLRKDHNFFEYTEKLLNKFLEKAKRIKFSAKSLNIKYRTIIGNYYKMIEKDKREIIKLLAN